MRSFVVLGVYGSIVIGKKTIVKVLVYGRVHGRGWSS